MKRFTIAVLVACGALSAQTPAQNQTKERNENANRAATGQAPIYRVTVTERTAKAISYQHRSGATKIDFGGTALMPNAHGEAKVESKKGYIEIEVEFRNMTDATQFGAEYLTYVLWAITPEGRTSNLGEILRGGGTSGKLNVTTELQAFGLLVTAEPYFAVSRPSDVVVMENVVRPDTVGKIELIDAKYELLQRGQYEHLANVLDLKVNNKMPLELYEARNAVHIARSSGADRYATETFQKAESNLKQAEAYRARNAGSKPVTMTARQAVQIAEDARAIAVKRQDDDLLANERQAGADRENRAENGRAAAESETARIAREAASARLTALAEADRLKRDNDAKTAAASTEADRLKRENDLRASAAQTEADRLKRENDLRASAAQTEADRLKRENELRASAAQTEADRLKRENELRASASQLEADRLRRDNDEQRAAAQSELDRIAREKGQLETDKADLRAQLLLQFNAILQTRDTARGLIVNLSDVLFDTAKFTLRPEAREKLAKVAGIVSGHPGLRLDVEGHTDNVGGDSYNQELSEHRGSAVRDYLTQQGMAQGSVTTKGFGKTQPIATNDTAAGRQQNRRVELVISGDIIGQAITVTVPIAAR
ncbi:MAG: OmpA/MotB domain protein [Bryobacterales bacterium]|nr:OmpA/MotB domain protein [Bryobacterales bacterium]